MSDKQKYKNGSNTITNYEHGFLFTLYRYPRLSSTRQVTATASPLNCIGRIESLAEIKDEYQYRVDVEDIEFPYTFRVEARTLWREGYTQNVIIGTIIPSPHNDQESMVFLRTYFGSWFLTDMFFLFLLLLLFFLEPLRPLFCYLCIFPFCPIILIALEVMGSKRATDRIVRRLQL